jgi:uncharacterized protein (TIGR03083 family)
MLSVEMIEGIKTVSEQLAVSASRNLDAPVEHCPGWTVRDLLVHIGEVQRFWARIVSERLVARPTDVPRGLPEGAEPIAWFRSQTTALTSALDTCADDVALWTWWDPEQHAGWVKRRQLDEVVIHAWDAANAVGVAGPIPVELAVVGLQEFVDVFACDLRGGAEPPAVSLVATDCDWGGVLFGGDTSVGNGSVGPGALPSLELRATASNLLLSLWGRVSVVDPAIASALAAIDLS